MSKKAPHRTYNTNPSSLSLACLCQRPHTKGSAVYRQTQSFCYLATTLAHRKMTADSQKKFSLPYPDRIDPPDAVHTRLIRPRKMRSTCRPETTPDLAL